MEDTDVVIIGAVRTPFGRYGGALRLTPSIDLGAAVIRELLRRTGLTGGQIDEVFYGTCEPLETGVEIDVPARQAILKAGLPPETVSMTLDTACCSSMDAVLLGSWAIKGGFAEVVIAAGAENMGRQPYFLPPEFRFGEHKGDLKLIDGAFRGGKYPVPGVNAVSVDAGNEALEHGVNREEQDRWALGSHQKYSEALAASRFTEEVMALELPQEKGPPVVLNRDEQHRPDTTLEKLAKLPTVMGSPTVTGGNAPGINAGASAMALTSRRRAGELGLRPLGALVANVRMAQQPNRIASAPAAAIRKALAEAGLKLDQMDLIEINEAFAAMPLVSTRILAEGDEARWRALLSRTIVNGGAVAIGHPVGATGARIIMTLMYELRRRGGGMGVAAICGGLGQGSAAIVRAETG
ncbi:MAG: thiolase family protein [Dehalococcoidia bacterium]|nr:thiolase family protein [Dehalococcoidia bacterium]